MSRTAVTPEDLLGVSTSGVYLAACSSVSFQAGCCVCFMVGMQSGNVWALLFTNMTVSLEWVWVVLTLLPEGQLSLGWFCVPEGPLCWVPQECRPRRPLLKWKVSCCFPALGKRLCQLQQRRAAPPSVLWFPLTFSSFILPLHFPFF